MKTTRTVLFALLLLGIPLAASAQLSVGAGVNFGSHGRASVDLGFFYDSLASYGNWIERPSHGWVWTPREVSASWRPYQAGHWVWSDEGWTWLSDEPYGWATYHYGRWYQDPEIGWAWVPGNDWAPAWVSWQEGQDYVGWAPLPPGANVNASYNGGGYAGGGYNSGGYDDGGYDDNYGYDDGYGDDNYRYDNQPTYGGGYGGGYGYDNGYGYGGGYYGGSYAYGIAPSAYLFVPVRSFLSVSLFDFYLPWVRVSSFFGHTRNCTYYGYHGGRYFNRGVPFDHVQRYYHNVPRYQLSELNGFRDRGYRVDGNRVAFFRPQVQRGRGITPLDRPNARRSVMRAEQFRAAFPDRAARVQRDRQDFRSREVQGAAPGQRQRDNQRGQQGQDRNGRQRIDYGQRYQQGREQGQQGQVGGQIDGRGRFPGQVQRQRQYDVPRSQDQAYRQRQFDAQRQNQDQVNRQRQFDAQRNQEQVNRQRQFDSQRQRQFDNQRGQAERQRQYSAPRMQERGYQQQPQRRYDTPRVQRQAPPQREYRNESRGRSDNGRGRGQDNGRRHGGHGNGQ